MLVDLGQQASSQNVEIPIFSKVTDPQPSALVKTNTNPQLFFTYCNRKNPSHVSS